MPKKKSLKIGEMEIIPLWSDSLGAKSFSIFVKTPDVGILVDPGVAIMQPSFPISDEDKFKYWEMAWENILYYSKLADIIIITHYHYDHYSPSSLEIYKDKTVLVKNPNEYINYSQRERAVDFYESLYHFLMNSNLKYVQRIKKIQIRDPMDMLVKAKSIDYGDYSERKKSLIEKGRKWFNSLAKKWNEWDLIPEIHTNKTHFYFADGREFHFGNTNIKFQQPMFHGIEFSRVGWVIPFTILYKNKKILYSSDLNGPIIEDYAEWIIEEDPDVLFLDGPATYMIPYTLNMINFRRCLKNIESIIRNIHAKYIFLDHHVSRDIRFKLRLEKIYNLAKANKKKVITFSEFFGRKSIAEKMYIKKKNKK